MEKRFASATCHVRETFSGAGATTDYPEEGCEHADSQPDRLPAAVGRCLDDARAVEPAHVAPLDRRDRVWRRLRARRLRACRRWTRRADPSSSNGTRGIPVANIQYFLAIDGLSALLVGLSTLLSFIAVIASWKIDRRPKFYFAMILLLAVGTNGVFMALDFVLFYVFWELVLVPMYFLIPVWGGERRAYAAVKFFLYTMLGAVMMLVGILALYLHPMGGTFDMLVLVDRGFPASFQWWAFLAFFIGFAVKVPVWPTAYVASRRPRRGADCGIRAARRNPAQDGNLRLPQDLIADPS